MTLTEKRHFVILTLSFIYLTISLACDPAAYRLINIFGLTMGGSGLIFASLYTLLDMLTRIAGRRRVYMLIIVFHLCDLLFSYVLYFITLLPSPASYKYQGLDMVLHLLPRLFWDGIIGAIIAGVVEVTIYSFLQSKTKNFIKASGIATIIILLAHNVPTEYFAFKVIYPDKVKEIVLVNFITGSLLLVFYSTLGFFALKLIDRFLKNERTSITHQPIQE